MNPWEDRELSLEQRRSKQLFCSAWLSPTVRWEIKPEKKGLRCVNDNKKQQKTDLQLWLVHSEDEFYWANPFCIYYPFIKVSHVSCGRARLLCMLTRTAVELAATPKLCSSAGLSNGLLCPHPAHTQCTHTLRQRETWRCVKRRAGAPEMNSCSFWFQPPVCKRAFIPKLSNWTSHLDLKRRISPKILYKSAINDTFIKLLIWII